MGPRRRAGLFGTKVIKVPDDAPTDTPDPDADNLTANTTFNIHSGTDVPHIAAHARAGNASSTEPGSAGGDSRIFGHGDDHRAIRAG